MAVYYRPVGGVPPWVLERMEYMGLEGVINALNAEASTATSNSDSTNATALTNMVTALQASAGFTDSHGASARLTFMAITKK